MGSRHQCAVCGTGFTSVRSDAKFCGTRCRMNAHRAALAGVHAALPARGSLRCAWCKASFTTNETGRVPRYCSGACRTRASRGRKRNVTDETTAGKKTHAATKPSPQPRRGSLKVTPKPKPVTKGRAAHARHETKQKAVPTPKPAKERGWATPLTQRERERDQTHRVLRIYHELLRDAGTTLGNAAATDGVPRAHDVERWVCSTPSVRITRLPAGVAAVARWLTQDAPRYSMRGFLEHSRTQKRAAALYRRYRKAPQRSSLEWFVRRLGAELEDRPSPARVRAQLDAWLDGRAPLSAELMQVLLAYLVPWEAERRLKV